MRGKSRADVITVPELSWTAGAPRPLLMASEDVTLFAFEDSSPESNIVVAEFDACLSVRFGFPNDEVLNGHPLWGRGLVPYAAHEVHQSAWLAEMRTIEKVHPRASREPFAGHRHLLLLFHDSTLEAIAKSITVHSRFASDADAVQWMATRIQ